MKYLSGMDNLFLNQETHSQHMHVGALGIYNPSTAKGGFVRFKTIIEFFTKRMAAAPVFRRKLSHSMLDIGRPFWVDDPHVDVEYHLRHMGLPEPGDWRQLMIQVARIHSRPMDLTRPLWEAYIIEGLDNMPKMPKGSFALYLKFHHSAVDGEAAAHLIANLHSLQANYTQDEDDPEMIVTQRPPQAMEILSRSVDRRIGQIRSLGGLIGSVGTYVFKTSTQAVLKSSGFSAAGIGDYLQDFLKPKKKTPMTRFNAKISPNRALDSVSFSLKDCNQIRQNAGAGTINDIFLTMVGGALRDYLSALGEEPESSLLGTMPMTLRGTDKTGDVGNQIAQVYYDLHSDIYEPLERLEAIRQEINALKEELDSGLGKDFQSRLLEILPANLIAKPLTKQVGESSNANVSNVRGPSHEMYMAGAKLERFIPFSLVLDGSGLNITGFSYNGQMDVAITCCRDMMPDPRVFCDCLAHSFEELKDAAAEHAGNQPKQPTKAKRVVKTKTRSKTKKKSKKQTKVSSKTLNRKKASKRSQKKTKVT